MIKDEMISVKDSDHHSFSIPLLVDINIGENLGLHDYNIEFKSKSDKVLETIEKVENLQNIVLDNNEKNKDNINQKIVSIVLETI